MKTVLVTGGIASGKSEVCKVISSCGFPVYDSDSRCKALYESVPWLKPRIEDALRIPFSDIGVIFSDPLRRELLESIVYPVLIEDFLDWRRLQDSRAVFLESAIALDKHEFDDVYDSVLVVRSAIQERIARNPKTSSRLASQKEVAPDIPGYYYIDNDGSLEELRKKTMIYLKTI